MNLNAECGVCKATVYYSLRLDPGDVTFGASITWTGRDGLMHEERTPPRQIRKAKIEATAITASGVVINYDPATDRWTESKFPHGVGNKGNPLIPYRIVAADQSVYPFGSRVTIRFDRGRENWRNERPLGHPTDRAPLIAYVGDTGGAINGPMRFDIYQTSDTDRMLHGEWWACVEPPKPLPMGEADKWDRSMARMAGIYQGTLAKLELYVGKIDGNFGPKSIAALTAFQKTVPEIPEIEYGCMTGAITRWWLAKAVSIKAKGGDAKLIA